jgi:mevalonate kinase
MKLNISERFTNYINQFFDEIDRQVSNEISSLKSQVEIDKTNLRGLMIIIHKEYEKGNISKEAYKNICSAYPINDDYDTFMLFKKLNNL